METRRLQTDSSVSTCLKRTTQAVPRKCTLVRHIKCISPGAWTSLERACLASTPRRSSTKCRSFLRRLELTLLLATRLKTCASALDSLLRRHRGFLRRCHHHRRRRALRRFRRHRPGTQNRRAHGSRATRALTTLRSALRVRIATLSRILCAAMPTAAVRNARKIYQ